MFDLNALLGVPMIIGLGQLLLGKVLKQNPNFPNLAIPLMTYLAAVFGYSLTPLPVQAAAVGGVVAATASVFLMALIQNLLITGIHSTFKNTVIPALKLMLLKMLQPKVEG